MQCLSSTRGTWQIFCENFSAPSARGTLKAEESAGRCNNFSRRQKRWSNTRPRELRVIHCESFHARTSECFASYLVISFINLWPNAISIFSRKLPSAMNMYGIISADMKSLPKWVSQTGFPIKRKNPWVVLYLQFDWYKPTNVKSGKFMGKLRENKYEKQSKLLWIDGKKKKLFIIFFSLPVEVFLKNWEKTSPKFQWKRSKS